MHHPSAESSLFMIGRSCLSRPQHSSVRGEFPCLDGILITAAQAVCNCWHEVYDCANEEVEPLKERLPSDEGEAVSKLIAEE